MGKEIGRSYKYNRPKSSSPTLKKPVLSSTANHTSCITISNQPVMSQTCQHKGSASNQDKGGKIATKLCEKLIHNCKIIFEKQ